MARKKKSWYETAVVDDRFGCTHDTRCSSCKPDGDCDQCETIDGRWMEAVNEYASTCDGCAELTMHEEMWMDPKTQLGYCEKCVKSKNFQIAPPLKLEVSRELKFGWQRDYKEKYI